MVKIRKERRSVLPNACSEKYLDQALLCWCSSLAHLSVMDEEGDLADGPWTPTWEQARKLFISFFLGDLPFLVSNW